MLLVLPRPNGRLWIHQYLRVQGLYFCLEVKVWFSVFFLVLHAPGLAEHLTLTTISIARKLIVGVSKDPTSSQHWSKLRKGRTGTQVLRTSSAIRKYTTRVLLPPKYVISMRGSISALSWSTSKKMLQLLRNLHDLSLPSRKKRRFSFNVSVVKFGNYAKGDHYKVTSKITSNMHNLINMQVQKILSYVVLETLGICDKNIITLIVRDYLTAYIKSWDNVNSTDLHTRSSSKGVKLPKTKLKVTKDNILEM